MLFDLRIPGYLFLKLDYYQVPFQLSHFKTWAFFIWSLLVVFICLCLSLTWVLGGLPWGRSWKSLFGVPSLVLSLLLLSHERGFGDQDCLSSSLILLQSQRWPMAGMPRHRCLGAVQAAHLYPLGSYKEVSHLASPHRLAKGWVIAPNL